MNWRRGLLRAWIVLSFIWMAYILIFGVPGLIRTRYLFSDATGLESVLFLPVLGFLPDWCAFAGEVEPGPAPFTVILCRVANLSMAATFPLTVLAVALIARWIYRGFKISN